jgi:hypothetical protein
MAKVIFYLIGIILCNTSYTESTHYKDLKAIIINENKEELLQKLDLLILENSDIPSQSNLIIQLDADNKIIRSRIYSPPSNQHNLIPKEAKSFIENEIQFTTLDEDALISNSVWYHIYIKPDL